MSEDFSGGEGPVRARAPRGARAVEAGAHCMGLLFYYNALGDAQAIRHALELGLNGGRTEVGLAGQALAMSASESLCRRFRLWGCVLGRVGSVTLAGLEEATHGFIGRGQVQLHLDLPGATVVPEKIVGVMTLAILLAGEGLSRGGTVRLSGDSGAQYILTLEGPQVGWPSSVLASFAGEDLLDEPAPRELTAVCLAAAAAAAGVTASMDLGRGSGQPCLRLQLPAGLYVAPDEIANSDEASSPRETLAIVVPSDGVAENVPRQA